MVDPGVSEETARLVATIDAVSARDTYDYIIIGGGTAGLLLANRLSEEKVIQVLVLEAGRLHEKDDLIEKPIRYLDQLGEVDHDWNFKTVPQSKANNRSISWHSGKGLGGSSNLNFMQWTRATKIDINNWERLGNPGWTWDNLLPYFKKSERFHQESESQLHSAYQPLDPSWFGRNGEISLSYAEYNPEGMPQVKKAFESLGIPSINHSFSGSNFGLMTSILTIDHENKTRASSYTSFLQPITSVRSNLDVLPGATATRIMIQDQPHDDSKPLSAEAVEFIYAGRMYHINARREVILCAGTVKSPHILELSGIGNRYILSKAGIDVKLHLPGVGENLQDHTYVHSVSFELKDDPGRSFNPNRFHSAAVSAAWVPLETVTRRAQGIQPIAELIPKTISKPFASTDVLENGTREQHRILAESLSHPEIPAFEILISHKLPTDASKPGKEYLSLAVGGIYPWSRGSIHVKSKDPLTYPEIEPNFFKEKIDLELILECLKMLRQLRNDSDMESIIAEEIDPGPTVSTDEDLRDYIRQNLSPFYHATGTLAMLPREKGGVVDPTLKVWGTDNIRVVDLSIVPMIVSVHTQSTAYVIAEVAADIIRGRLEWL